MFKKTISELVVIHLSCLLSFVYVDTFHASEFSGHASKFSKLGHIFPISVTPLMRGRLLLAKA